MGATIVATPVTVSLAVTGLLWPLRARRLRARGAALRWLRRRPMV